MSYVEEETKRIFNYYSSREFRDGCDRAISIFKREGKLYVFIWNVDVSKTGATSIRVKFTVYIDHNVLGWDDYNTKTAKGGVTRYLTDEVNYSRPNGVSVITEVDFRQQ